MSWMSWAEESIVRGRRLGRVRASGVVIGWDAGLLWRSCEPYAEVHGRWGPEA